MCSSPFVSCSDVSIASCIFFPLLKPISLLFPLMVSEDFFFIFSFFIYLTLGFTFFLFLFSCSHFHLPLVNTISSSQSCCHNRQSHFPKCIFGLYLMFLFLLFLFGFNEHTLSDYYTLEQKAKQVKNDCMTILRFKNETVGALRLITFIMEIVAHGVANLI